MAENKDTLIVVIPVDDEHNRKLIVSPIQNHPLAEISRSPGHFLLLKLWQREEHLYGRRLSRKESRKDTIGREIFQLSLFFFVFHGLFFTILFTSDHHRRECGKWWIPCVVSSCTSFVFVFLVQLKLYRYWKIDRQLQKDRTDGRTLTRCVQELRMKGASFDLKKEPQMNGKRMKSSSVEINWKPLRWCSEYRITVFLVCFTGLVLPLCRFVLCG